ncbi:hypothetical protein Dimus_022852 [Dionaea muscipula]
MEKRKVDAEGRMKEKDERIQELQGKLRKEEEDHQAIGRLLREEEEKRRGVEAEAEHLKDKRNELQRELKDSLEEYLAEAERMSVQHYIKTEEFKAAMARLNRLWYATGFDICKL